MLTFDGAFKVKTKNRKGLSVRLIVSLRMKMDFYRHTTSSVAKNDLGTSHFSCSDIFLFIITNVVHRIIF
jgi:hypothetical protein